MPTTKIVPVTDVKPGNIVVGQGRRNDFFVSEVRQDGSMFTLLGQDDRQLGPMTSAVSCEIRVEADDDSRFTQIVNDAIQDGPVVLFDRDRGIIHVTIAPAGDFGDELDTASISLNIEDLAEALAKMGVVQ